MAAHKGICKNCNFSKAEILIIWNPQKTPALIKSCFYTLTMISVQLENISLHKLPYKYCSINIWVKLTIFFLWNWIQSFQSSIWLSKFHVTKRMNDQLTKLFNILSQILTICVSGTENNFIIFYSTCDHQKLHVEIPTQD
jgi:hypothetical protein